MSSIIRTIILLTTILVLLLPLNIKAEDFEAADYDKFHPAVKAYLEASDPIVGSGEALRKLLLVPKEELTISEILTVLKFAKEKAVICKETDIASLIRKFFDSKNYHLLNLIYTMMEFDSNPGLFIMQVNLRDNTWVIMDFSEEPVFKYENVIYKNVRKITIEDTSLIVGAPTSLGRYGTKPNTEYLIVPGANRFDIEYTGKTFIGGDVFRSDENPNSFHVFDSKSKAQVYYHAAINYDIVYPQIGEYVDIKYVGNGLFLITPIDSEARLIVKLINNQYFETFGTVGSDGRFNIPNHCYETLIW